MRLADDGKRLGLSESALDVDTDGWKPKLPEVFFYLEYWGEFEGGNGS